MDNKVEVQIESMKTFQEFFYSGDMKFLYFLMILMLVDIVTGFAKALKNQNLWSKKSLKGTAKKMLIFCIIILANIIDMILNLNGALLTMTVLYYIAHEGLSIVENCAEMDVLAPEQIKEKLKVMDQDSKDDKNDKEV